MGPKHPYTSSIRTKLVAVTIVVVLGFAALIAGILLAQSRASYEQQTQDATQQTIEQLAQNIDNYFDDLNRLIITICSSSYLMESLEVSPGASAYEQLERRRSIERLLDDIMVIPREDIISVYILADEIFRGGRVVGNIDAAADYHSFDWYNSAMQTGKPEYLSKHLEQLVTSPRYTVFSLVRRINTVRGAEKALGVIKVDANVRSLQRICGNVHTGTGGALLIMDGAGSVQYASIDEGEALDRFAAASHEADSRVVSLGGRTYIYNRAKIERPGWYVVAFQSTERLAAATRTAALWVIACTAGACVLLAFVLVMLFSSQFIKPLYRVTGVMESVQRGNLDARFPENRSDEIGYLGFSANRMLREINDAIRVNAELNAEVYKTRLLQNKAELSALQSRIRPHFIYNTLNLISLQVQCGRASEAVENLHRLSFLMRAMAKSSQVIAVSDELKLLEAYLEIQSSRYQGRLDYSVDVSPDTMQMQVPALLLQPIIENAIVHGAENNPGKTSLRVYDRAEPDALLLVVEDDALGMPPETLEAIQRKLSAPDIEAGAPASGIGLANTSARIKLFFGANFGLHIESSPGRGTRVTLRLPPANHAEPIHPIDREGKEDAECTPC